MRPPPVLTLSEKMKEYKTDQIINSTHKSRKIKTKLRLIGITLILPEKYPAKYPMIVFAIPATPKTLIEKESWIRPQIAPKQAP
jgi:hypothetical protein